MQCHQKEAYGNPAFFQICAFGLPAIQTVIALVAKLVDADELLGMLLKIFNRLQLTNISTIFRNLLRWQSIRQRASLVGGDSSALLLDDQLRLSFNRLLAQKNDEER